MLAGALHKQDKIGQDKARQHSLQKKATKRAHCHRHRCNLLFPKRLQYVVPSRALA